MDDSDNPFLQRQPPRPIQIDNDASKRLSSQLKALTDWANDIQVPLDLKLSNRIERSNCLDVVRTFYNHVLQSFPSPSEYTWAALHEKITLIDASFAVFSRVGAAFCSADDFAAFSKDFWRHILGICCVLEQWIDHQDVTTDADCPTPRELYEKGESACVGLLRTWFGRMQTETSGVRGWQVAKEIVEECLSLCHGKYRECLNYRHLLTVPQTSSVVRLRANHCMYVYSKTPACDLLSLMDRSL